jgi:hypothetical protein
MTLMPLKLASELSPAIGKRRGDQGVRRDAYFMQPESRLLSQPEASHFDLFVISVAVD